MKARRLALVVAGAFSVAVMMAGPAQAVCDPYCSQYSNKGGVDRGVTRANAVADPHGQHGRDKAAENPGKYKPTPDTGGSTGGDTGTTGGDTGGTGGTGDTGGTGSGDGIPSGS
ncbi:MAG TPA: hypothetical protein VJL88_04070 [Nitrospira sp.]|nr:hypothetical protein [Nitrospira sp.]